MLRPVWVAVVGAVVVAFLLVFPIRILAPGGHEMVSCGNALASDLARWRDAPDGNYWDPAYQTCTSDRIDRVAWAVGVLSVTVLAVTVLSLRRRDPADDLPFGG